MFDRSFFRKDEKVYLELSSGYSCNGIVISNMGSHLRIKGLDTKNIREKELTISYEHIALVIKK